MNGEEVMDLLVKGNDRYLTDTMEHPNQGVARMKELLSGQSPHTAILTCSDSRVVPELIFDQGIGDLFIIRNAGNVVSNVALGSLEYAAVHLEVPLMVILGHSQCGAVGAAMAGGEAEGSLGSIMNEILPAVESCKGLEENVYLTTIHKNMDNSFTNILQKSPFIKKRVDDGRLLLVEAFYSLETGEVAFYI